MHEEETKEASGDKDEIPPPAKTTSTQDALRNVRDPVTDIFGPAPGSGGAVGAATASGFLSFYPFLRLFRAVAVFQKPRDIAPESHVAALRKDHPIFYGFCIALDALFVLVASSMLLTAAGFAIYKTFVK